LRPKQAGLGFAEPDFPNNILKDSEKRKKKDNKKVPISRHVSSEDEQDKDVNPNFHTTTDEMPTKTDEAMIFDASVLFPEVPYDSQPRVAPVSHTLDNAKQSLATFYAAIQKRQEDIKMQQNILDYITTLMRMRQILKFSAWNEETCLNVVPMLEKLGDLQAQDSIPESLFKDSLSYILTLLMGYFKKEFLIWNILGDPNWGLDTLPFFQALATFYDRCAARFSQSKTAALIEPKNTHYWLFFELWLPKMKILLNHPSFSIIRDSEFLISLLQAWQSVVPQNVQSILIQQFLLPKFTILLTSTDCPDLTCNAEGHSILHAWLIPWFTSSVLNSLHLVHLLPAIIEHYKFQVTQEDLNAPYLKNIMVLWSSLLDAPQLARLLSAVITPKFSFVLQKANLTLASPSPPRYLELELLFSWSHLYTPAAIISILEKSFFIRWLHFIYNLVVSNECSDTIITFYTFFKAQIPTSMRQSPCFQVVFITALDIINSTLDNPSLSFEHFL
jgi:hypothetical protein